MHFLRLHGPNHSHSHYSESPISSSPPPPRFESFFSCRFQYVKQRFIPAVERGAPMNGERRRRRVGCIVSVAAPPWNEGWKPEKGSKAPSLSDVVWPSAGAFAAMAIMGRIDQIMAPRGLSMTIAPFGAVCAVLFATPSSPAARKYNMFMAQIGCAAIGVFAFSVFGAGWLARSAALAASIAFMIYARAPHPPAASLPLLFIDGMKLQHLNLWYALFPGAAGCILLCFIEMVCYLRDNFRF